MANKNYTKAYAMKGLSTRDLIKNLLGLLAFQYQTHAVRYVRVTDEYVDLQKLCNKGSVPGNDRRK